MRKPGFEGDVTMHNMIAYCGLDCEKCDAYLATIHNDQALREKTAKLWAELNNAPFCRNTSTARAVGAMGSKQYSVTAFAVFGSVR